MKQNLFTIKHPEVSEKPYNPNYFTGGISKEGVIYFYGTDDPELALDIEDIKILLNKGEKL